MTPPFAHVIDPVTHDLGGFKVHRVLPSPGAGMIGPFAFVDEFGPATLGPGQAMDVRPHPHINLSTVTYLFEGAIDHRDSLGTQRTITPGAVNLMTAGRGIVHSERSPADTRDRDALLFGMQTWLALPEALEETDPAFEHVAADDLPVIESGGASARVVMGSLWGQRAPTTCHAETIYAAIALEPGGAVPIDAGVDERAVMLVDGEGAVDGAALERFKLYLLAPGTAVRLSSERGGRAILLGGEAFPKGRYMWWNFISSRPERIEAAKIDWREGRFPKVPSDAEERIPLPDGEPKTVAYP